MKTQNVVDPSAKLPYAQGAFPGEPHNFWR